jgi:hypothetical protein
MLTQQITDHLYAADASTSQLPLTTWHEVIGEPTLS